MKSPYPTCDMWAGVREQVNGISAFKEWMETKNLELGEYHEGVFYPSSIRIDEKTLCDVFAIDYKKLEEERRAMISALNP